MEKKKTMKIFSFLRIGEWLRCDDHVIEQTTFEAVKTSDAYILVYSRCMGASSLVTNPSGKKQEEGKKEKFDLVVS